MSVWMWMLTGVALGVLGTLYVNAVRDAYEGRKALDAFYDRLEGTLPADQVYGREPGR